MIAPLSNKSQVIQNMLSPRGQQHLRYCNVLLQLEDRLIKAITLRRIQGLPLTVRRKLPPPNMRGYTLIKNPLLTERLRFLLKITRKIGGKSPRRTIEDINDAIGKAYLQNRPIMLNYIKYDHKDGVTPHTYYNFRYEPDQWQGKLICFISGGKTQGKNEYIKLAASLACDPQSWRMLKYNKGRITPIDIRTYLR